MSGTYDAQQVCLNGHQQTACFHANPEFRKDFCSQCGASTIHQCPKCSKDIQGYFDVPGTFSFAEVEVPAFCKGCGVEFPWAAKNTGSNVKEPTAEQVLQRLFTRFPLFVQELKSRRKGREPLELIDEYDVHYVLGAMLKLHFDDVRPEDFVPNHAGSSSRMDFSIRDASIAVEVKMTRSGLGDREVGDQLLVDIDRYQKHPDCSGLFFLVYDPQRHIRNPRGLEKDLSKADGKPSVRVFVVW